MKPPATKAHFTNMLAIVIALLVIVTASTASAFAAGTWYGNGSTNGWSTGTNYNNGYGTGNNSSTGYGTTYGDDSGYSWWYRQGNSGWGGYNGGSRPPAPSPAPSPSPSPSPAPSPSPTPPPPTQPPASGGGSGSGTGTLTPDEARSFQLINEARQQNGIAPLELNPTLVKVAREKANDMADKGYFGHYSPTYGSPYDHLQANGVSYRWAGENIAEMGSVDAAHDAFMQSSGHRANILSKAYTQVGVGVARRGRTVYIAQEFIKPAN